ncbi:MAG: hypothetical protein QTN59_00485 [Candidatus Electrothrix communis]|nr:MAG: hypothetical protein QTN59_00485 [Candidatus Electrothrix communis]
MNDPQSFQEWIDTAKERASDADAMLPTRNNSVGPAYMAGYAIECMLKAYLKKTNRSFSTRGKGGHNLRGLWLSAGFRLSDLTDRSGAKAFFVEDWDTALRYQSNIDELTHSTEELVAAAKQLTGWINKNIQRNRRML